MVGSREGAEMGVRIEMQWEVCRVTEWKDGCVFKTEHVEYRWLPVGSPLKDVRPDGDPNLFWSSRSSTAEGKDHRTVVFTECLNCERPNFHTEEECHAG
jgi:hypothetical protein